MRTFTSTSQPKGTEHEVSIGGHGLPSFTLVVGHKYRAIVSSQNDSYFKPGEYYEYLGRNAYYYFFVTEDHKSPYSEYTLPDGRMFNGFIKENLSKMFDLTTPSKAEPVDRKKLVLEAFEMTEDELDAFISKPSE